MSLGIYIFDERPNWGQPVKVALGFQTNVMRNYHESEQRISLRGKPRLGIEFTIDSKPTAVWRRSFTEALLAKVCCPIWTVPIAATSSSYTKLFCSYNPIWFKVGGWVYIESTRSKHLITSLDSNGISIVARDTTGGAERIYPCILGVLKDATAQFSIKALGIYSKTVRVEEI